MFKAQQNIATKPPELRRYGVEFDGVDDVLSTPKNLDYLQISSGAATISFWVKIDTSGSKYIASETVNASNGWYIVASDNSVSFWVDNASGGTTVLNASWLVGGASANKWTNYVISFKTPGSIKAYRNGIESTSYSAQDGNIPSALGTASGGIVFGKFIAWGAAQFFSDFQMSEFVVYEGQLTDDLILTMYNKKEPFDHTNWKLAYSLRHLCTFGDLSGGDYWWTPADTQRNIGNLGGAHLKEIDHINYVR